MGKKGRVSETLRRAIVDADESRYHIARAVGLPESTLSRFVHGGGARSATIDRLADYFGLELRPVAKRKRKGR